MTDMNSRLWILKAAGGSALAGVALYAGLTWFAGGVEAANAPDSAAPMSEEATLQASIDGLQASLTAVNLHLVQLSQRIDQLNGDSAAQLAEIAHLRSEMDHVQRAVRVYGVSVPADGFGRDGLALSAERWTALKAEYGISYDEPVVFSPPPIARP